ncbi:hypothetical protein VPH35_037923 [Triticum aestivum]
MPISNPKERYMSPTSVVSRCCFLRLKHDSFFSSRVQYFCCRDPGEASPDLPTVINDDELHQNILLFPLQNSPFVNQLWPDSLIKPIGFSLPFFWEAMGERICSRI